MDEPTEQSESTNANPADLAERAATEDGPKPFEKYKREPMSEESGWTLLGASAAAAAVIALATLVLEVATDQWLARVLGFGFYVTTPLGVGATFLTILVARNDVQRAVIPGILVIIYWIIYFGA